MELETEALKVPEFNQQAWLGIDWITQNPNNPCSSVSYCVFWVYGLPEDEVLFHLRTLKEAVHEIGHVLGLGHCPDPRCIMHFSNAIGDTDMKGPGFCRKCKAKISP